MFERRSMSVSELDQQVYELPNLNSGELTILLGAGASAASELPDWQEMVSKLLVSSGIAESEVVANEVSSREDLVLLAEAVHTRCNGDDASWISALREALYGGIAPAKIVPTAMQLNAALVAFEHLGSVKLATLNFDELLDQAVTEVILGWGDEADMALSDEDLELLKVEHLHGTIPLNENERTVVNRLVFSFFDYLFQIKSKEPPAKLFLDQAMKRGSLLIAGTSFRDPDMRQWLSSILQAKSDDDGHAACILLARESYRNVDKEQFCAMKPVLEAQWKSLGFNPVFVDDYEDVAQLILECPHVLEKDYLSPSERLNRLWECLTDEKQFRDIQERFVNMLQENKDEMKRMLPGGGRMNATLWVAHDDKLVRFASHDRIYLRSSLLRADPSGFDSPYVAGRAYGANKVKTVTLDDWHVGGWRTVIAHPIQVDPDTPFWCTPLPIGVLSFGIEEVVEEADEENDSLMKLLTGMILQWSKVFERLIENWRQAEPEMHRDTLNWKRLEYSE